MCSVIIIAKYLQLNKNTTKCIWKYVYYTHPFNTY
jgi:hypothetical protein